MKKIVFILFVFISKIVAQTPINSSFERGNDGFIKRWSLTDNTNLFDLKADTTFVYDGRISLLLSNKPVEGLEKKYGTFFNTARIPLNLLKGKKKLTISAYIRADSTSKDVAMWANTIGTKIQPTYQNTISQGKVSTEWKKYIITLPIDSFTRVVNFGGFVLGKSRAWFDKFEFYLDDNQIKDMEVGVMPDIDQEVIKTINKCKVEIDDLNLLTTSIEFEKGIKSFYNNQQIIAIGEGTHGTSEFFKMKNKIIKTLVEKNNLDIIIAFENSFGSTSNINEYILYGKGNPRDLIKRNFFSVWQTEELLELVEWIKQYNSKNNKKITFVGFDMQSSFDVLKLLKQSYNSDSLTEAINEFRKIDSLIVKNPKEIAKSIKDLEIKLTIIEKIIKNNTYKIVTDSLKKIASQSIAVLKQYVGKYNKPINLSYRDSCMAININWIAKNYNDKKIVVWAHNGHVMKDAKQMGGYLANIFKNNYLSIGQTTFNGSYTSFDNYGMSKKSSLLLPYKDCYEYWLNKVDKDNWLLDLHRIEKNKSVNTFFNLEMEFRSIGFREQQYQFSDINILNNFDILIFIKESSPSTFMK